MEEARANSLRIYFGPGKQEPSELGIFQFMKLKMRLIPEHLLAMYKEPKEHSVYVKFKTEDQLKDALLRLPSNMEFAYDKYESTTVTFSAASSIFKYVRIFNLPPEIDDGEISEVLSKFGIIQRMVRERYGAETGFPIWTSVRGVHMEIQREIPSTIHVRNYQARVYYDGLLNKCFVCGSTEHVKATCPKRVSVNDRMQQKPGAVPYSEVAAGPARWMPYSRAKKSREDAGGNAGGMVVLGNVVAGRTGTIPKVNIESDKVVRNEMENETLAGPSGADCATANDDNVEESEARGGVEAQPDDPSLFSKHTDELDQPEAVELSDDEMLTTPDGAEENGFKKVTGKRTRRGREVKKDESRTVSETSSESDPGVPTASISSAQSMLTRSKLKQRKVSESSKNVGEVGDRVLKA